MDRCSPLWCKLDGTPDAAALGTSFAWGFAEAVSWPVMAEMYLIWFAAPTPRRLWPMAGALAAGSVSGVLVHAAAARHGRRFPAPWTTPRMLAAAREHLRASPAGVIRQPLNGIPVKLYASAAAEERVSFGAFAAATAVARPARVAAVTLLLTPAARLLQRPVRRFYGTYLAASGAVFTVLLRKVIASWR